MNNTFGELIRMRRSYRQFLSTPVNDEVIKQVLEDAQYTPSNCNTQPWDVHIVSGNKKDELSKALVKANKEGKFNPDFDFDVNHYYGRYSDRQKEQGKAYYEALGVKRTDIEGRKRATERNLEFFNAPHVAFLFMPKFGDNVRVASDIGMYAQSFLLSLTSHGIGSIPQTLLGFHADIVRDTLGVPEELKLLSGISFGYPDLESIANSVRMGRDSIEKNVSFHN